MGRSDLPSGRTFYRRTFDYQLELKQLAQRYPTLVREFRLTHRTIEGRDVEGIEISANAEHVRRQADLPDHGPAPCPGVALQ